MVTDASLREPPSSDTGSHRRLPLSSAMEVPHDRPTPPDQPVTRPRLVLVHGAWHQPWVWGPLIRQLPDWTVDLVDLPSSKPDVLGDLAADVAAVRAELIREDGPVAVMAHSYGGIPASEAISGVPGVVHTVYLGAFLPSPGDSLLSMVGTDPSWWKRNEDAGTIGVVDPAQRFYSDLAPDLVSAAVDHLRPQSARSFEGQVRRPSRARDTMTYMVCDADQAIPPAAQQAMGESCAAVFHLDTGHTPMLADTAAVAAVLHDRLSD